MHSSMEMQQLAAQCCQMFWVMVARRSCVKYKLCCLAGWWVRE